MGDLIINGGNVALDVGNQQFTVRNVTINGSNTGVKMTWNWGWNFQGITINNAQVGFEVKVGTKVDDSGQGTGAIAIIDAVVRNTPVFYRSSQATTQLQSSIVLNNVVATNVPTIVGIVGGQTVLAGSTGQITIDTWVQGNTYAASSSRGYLQGKTTSVPKQQSLLENGRIFSKGRPTYASYDTSQVVSVKAEGAKGDGQSDDTAALQAVFDKVSIANTMFQTWSLSMVATQFAGCRIIFFDAGTYLVSDTLKIPAGVQIFGETWAVVAGTGSKFNDINNPKVVVQVGTVGSQGIAEIGGIIFSTRGPSQCSFLVYAKSRF